MTKSKAFLFICLFFIGGVVFASYFQLVLLVKYLLIILSLILICVWWRVFTLRILGFCFLFFILGIARYNLALPKEGSEFLKFYNDKEKIIFEGKIVDEPDVRIDKTNLTVEADKIYFSKRKINFDQVEKENLTSRPIEGRVLISLPPHPRYEYGQRVLVFGKLKTPFETDNFSYKDYLARSKIYSVVYYPEIKVIDKARGNPLFSFLFKVKDKFEKTINQIMPEPHASFLAGLLLGARRSIPQDLLDKFNITGVTHIIALSGYNITIISVAVRKLFSDRISRKTSFLLSCLFIFLFVILTGAQASCVRAAIMGVLALLALNIGRFSNITNLLAFAGAMMLLINPLVFANDLGFQLSFLATIGIVYFAPYLLKLFHRLPEFFEVRETFVLTISAQLLVVPVILHNFGRFSLIAPLANLLILPVIPFTMFFGFLAGVCGQIVLFFGKVFGFISWVLLNYEIFVVDFFAKFPFASFQFEKIWDGWLWIYYGLILITFFFLRKKVKLEPTSI